MRTLSLGIDAQSFEVRVIEVIANSVGDAPMLPALLEQISPEEALVSVSDGTKVCHAAIASPGASALTPVRKNAQPWKEGSAGAQARNENLRTTQRLDQAIWKKLSGDRRRSLVEAKMRCFGCKNSGIKSAAAPTAIASRASLLG